MFVYALVNFSSAFTRNMNAANLINLKSLVPTNLVIF